MLISFAGHNTQPHSFKLLELFHSNSEPIVTHQIGVEYLEKMGIRLNGAASSLDGYHIARSLERLKYAKPK